MTASAICLTMITFGVKAIGLGDTRVYEFEQADKKLNIVYKAIFNKLNLIDQQKFKISQRAWRV